MIKFHRSADPHAAVVVRVGLDAATSEPTEHAIASLQWHRDRPPRIVPYMEASFTFEEAVEMTAELAKLAGRIR